MRRQNPRPYLLLVTALFLALSFPKPWVERLRGSSIACCAPIWKSYATISAWGSQLVPSQEEKKAVKSRLDELERENCLLRSEITKLQELVQHELHLMTQMSAVINRLPAAKEWESLLPHHQEQIRQLFSFKLKACPAQVIYRSSSSWNSTLWVNVGASHNKEGEPPIIAQNSPVIAGSSVVGVIDYVGQHQSRVRLITDSGLVPSVRAIRGTPQDLSLYENVQVLLSLFTLRSDLFSSAEEKAVLIEKLEGVKRRILTVKEGLYLAKGELHGSSQPLWRKPGSLLRGIGFNYDFPDEEGSARDLRTGKVLDGKASDKGVPLLKVHDLLVTTGFDGVFPPGLPVAEVTAIEMLREGDYFYTLEAKPCAGNLDRLNLVFVLPPLGYQATDQPGSI